MLKQLTISKFKNVEQFDAALGSVTILVGTNNSGKTSVLNAVHTAVAIAQSIQRIRTTPAVNSRSGVFSINVSDMLYMPSTDPSWLAWGGTLTATVGPQISFVLDDALSSQGSVSFYAAEGRNLKVQLEGDALIEKIERIDSPFSVYVPGLAGIARTEESMSKGSLLRAVARGDANLVLRNVLCFLAEEASKWTRFMLALAEVYPGHELEVVFDRNADEHIGVFVRRAGTRIPLDCAGTGFLQTVQILSYVFLFEPAVTLLDEPDSHLHPNNQRRLATLLLRLASEGRTKIMMATHSRHIIDAVRGKPNAGLTWIRAGKIEPTTTHVALLSELGALDSAEGLLAGGIDFVVLTEDEDKLPIGLLLQANGAVAGKYQLWAYKGCAKLDVAEALGNFIREVSPTTAILIHRDSDFMADSDKNFLVQQYKDYGIDVFLPPTPDPEGVLCRIDHLKAINPGKDGLIVTAFDRAIQADGDQLREAARKGREANDDRRHKLRQATEGEQAIRQWSKELPLADERWRHGKIFRAKVRQHYQQLAGANLKTDEISPALRIPELSAWIAAKHAPNVTGVPAQKN